MKKLLVLSLAFVLIISALLLLAGCKKECDHSYERTVITPSTCTAAGEEKFSCTKCDHFYTAEIKATGHTAGTPVEENRVDSCVAECKYDSVVYCTVCDVEVSRETVTVTEKIHDVQNGVCTACGGRESTLGLKYSQNADGTYTVTGIGTCTETDIVIGIYNNRDVTTIGSYAFSGCTSLTSIELPDSLTTIGDEAFYGCASLTSIELPDSLTTIGDHLFHFCDSLASIDLPDSLTTIGEYAFYYCKSLTSIELPDSLTTIGEYAFSACTSLTSIVIPEGVTTIGDAAFAYCTSLTSIELPDSLTTIGVDAFYNCTSLTSIELPDSITAIGSYAFYCCELLASIELPDSLTTIDEMAFAGCISLTSIVIPEGVTTIGHDAFYYCESLTIYCEVTKRPSGWSNVWNSSFRPVVWGYTGE